jgi:hypothetical protein
MWLPLRSTASSCHEPTDFQERAVLGSKDKKPLKTDIWYGRNEPDEKITPDPNYLM